MTQKLNPQAEIIYQILLDNAWHCPIDWKYSDGHGKRLTDINRYLLPKGKKLDWKWCDCGRHAAQIKARRIVSVNQNFDVQAWMSQWKKKEETKELTLF